MKVKISAGLSAVLPTGQFQNMRPSFTAEVEFDCDADGNTVSKVIKKNQTELYKICEGMVAEASEKARVEKVKQAMANFHWYKLADGSEVPSVTAILSVNDSGYDVPPEELTQYASQSLLCHGQVAHFISSGKWVEPKELTELWSDIRVVQLGSLALSLSGWNFPAFLDKYPIRTMKNGTPSTNKKHRYGGTPDFTGIPMGWDKVKGYEHVKEVPTLFDVKRTKEVVKNSKQLAAYSRMDGYEGISQLCIIELNDKTAQGFSKPEVIAAEKNEGFFQMFLRDRDCFRKVYGL